MSWVTNTKCQAFVDGSNFNFYHVKRGYAINTTAINCLKDKNNKDKTTDLLIHVNNPFLLK